MILERLRVPVVQAPMAGGPSTAALALAVDRAGGLGFVAAGYLTAERLTAELDAVAAAGMIGVNVFADGDGPAADPASVAAYAQRLAPDAECAGVVLGTPRHDDDAYAEKLALLIERPVAVVSFTFGLPGERDVDDLHRAGSEVWVTVTSVAEAVAAVERGADVLVVQGVEAGGHRGVFSDDDRQSQLTLLAALQLIGAAVSVPLVGAGAIVTGAGLAAALAAGASAGQLGTALLAATEAGTSRSHREAITADTPTTLTRAFSGRTARAIENAFLRAHNDEAPAAYPEVHHLTSPLRAHGRAIGDGDLINLWAGQAHQLASPGAAGEIISRIVAEARTAVAQAVRSLG